MPNSLAPGFIKVNYHSAFGPHVMILPVLGINIETPAVDSTIDTHSAGTILWTTMVTALVTEMADQYPTNCTFDIATLFNQPTADDDPQPISGVELGIDGTVAVPGWAQGTQLTISARTADFNPAKLVMLDFASGGLFTKTTVASGSGLEALLNEWTALTNGWCGRDNTRPSQFVSATRTLNEKLRRNYNLA